MLCVFGAVGVIGAVVAWRRSHNASGWLFLAIFVLIGVSGLLAAVYGAVVILGSRLVAPLGAGSDLTVAAATLAAAAPFAPAPRRIQTVVDRRFNRARYDAEQVVARFRARLRDEVDLDQLGAELRATVQAAVEPAATTVWLRAEEAER